MGRRQPLQMVGVKPYVRIIQLVKLPQEETCYQAKDYIIQTTR